MQGNRAARQGRTRRWAGSEMPRRRAGVRQNNHEEYVSDSLRYMVVRLLPGCLPGS
jgi:hypothetical protein